MSSATAPPTDACERAIADPVLASAARLALRATGGAAAAAALIAADGTVERVEVAGSLVPSGTDAELAAVCRHVAASPGRVARSAALGAPAGPPGLGAWSGAASAVDREPAARVVVCAFDPGPPRPDDG
jgi:hypothetical protein